MLAQQFAEPGVLQGGVNILPDSRQHDVGAFATRNGAKVLQVVHTGGIDEGNAAHADDAYQRAVGHGGHQVFKLIGNAEEVGTVNLIYLHTVGNDEVLLVKFRVGLIVGVNLVGNHLDLCCLGHTAHEEQTGNEQTDLNGDGQVENDREEEGH